MGRLASGPLAPQDAAKLMLEVSQAVDYAHERGVIHRDLKPANILISATGQPRVTDFGLAKQVDDDSGQTQAGAVLGTPSYMPPEQAAGHGSEVGPLADVYSLGATLYCLVTGRPPFQAARVAETLKQVMEQEPVSPRQLNASVDSDLETICLKCLQKEPALRYSSANELAGDLSRYLEGQPIQARPISTFSRFVRWCRRNPRLATLTGAFLLALLIGTSVSTFFAIQSARNAERYRKEFERANIETGRAKTALGRESEALKRLTAQLKATEDAIDNYVKTVSNAQLLKDARFQPLLKTLLKDALDHYQSYVKQYGDATDPPTLERLSDTLFRIGWINDESGSKDEALKAYLKALAIRQRLARMYPSDQHHQKNLAKSHANLGTVYLGIGNVDKAVEEYERGRQLFQGLARQHPKVTEYQSLIGSILSNLGNLYRETGQLKKAKTVYQDSLEIRERLTQETQTNPANRDVAISLNQIGVLYYEMNNLPEALTFYQRMLAIRKRLVKAHPNDVLYRRELAGIYNNIGLLFQDLKKPNDALQEFQKSLEMRRQISFEHPTIDLYQAELATIQFNLGRLHRHAGRPTGALKFLQQALAIQEQLTKANPQVNDFQFELARTAYTIGLAYRTTGKTSEALKFFQQGLKIQELLVKKHPSVIEYRSSLALSHYSLGRLYRSARQYSEAESEFQKAIAIQQQLAREQPAILDYQRRLGSSYNSIGIVYDYRKKRELARDAYLKALAIHELLAREKPTDTEHQLNIAGALTNLANLEKRKDSKKALKRLARAVELLEGVLNQYPKDRVAQRFIRNTFATCAEVYMDRKEYDQAADQWLQAKKFEDGDRKVYYGALACRALALADHHSQASELADKLVKETRYADDLVSFAQGYALSITAAMRDPKLNDETRRQLSDRYAVKAITCLTQAARANYFANSETRKQDLKTNKDFDALRDHQAFRELLEDINK